MRCLPHPSIGRRTSGSSQKLCFIMNEWWCVSTRCCFNWHKGRGALMYEALWRRRETSSSLPRSPPPHPPSFKATEAVGRACQPCEGNGRDKAWAGRRHQIKRPFDFPDWGKPLEKWHQQRLSFYSDKNDSRFCESVAGSSEDCDIKRYSRSNKSPVDRI